MLGLLLENEKYFRKLTRVSESIGCVTISLAFLAYQLLLHPFPQLSYLYSCAAFALLLSMATTTAENSVLASSWVVWIGRRAYSIYLLHVIAIQAVTKLLPDGRGPVIAVAATLLAFAFATLLADLMFRFIEKPLIAKGKMISAQISRGACS